MPNKTAASSGIAVHGNPGCSQCACTVGSNCHSNQSVCMYLVVMSIVLALLAWVWF